MTRKLAKENEDELKDAETWSDFIYNNIKEYLIPEKAGYWFCRCYSDLQAYVTYCRPNFTKYYESFFNGFMRIVLDGYEFDRAYISAFQKEFAANIK